MRKLYDVFDDEKNGMRKLLIPIKLDSLNDHGRGLTFFYYPQQFFPWKPNTYLYFYLQTRPLMIESMES